MNSAPHLHRLPSRHRQAGVALFVALIALVIMALAGIALIRIVDTSGMIASNTAFRQSARESTDVGLEDARKYLLDQALISDAAALDSDSPANGYYAKYGGYDYTSSAAAGTKIAWQNSDGSTINAGSTAPSCQTTATGDRVCYIIERMCDSTGPRAITMCDVFVPKITAAGATQSRYDLILEPVITGNTLSPGAIIYRVTVRASGVRGTTSYVQVFVAG